MDRGGWPDRSVRARGTVTALTAGAILQAASRAGLDTTLVATSMGLSGVDLDDFTARITTEQLFGLWELVMRQAADPSLPVRAAQLSFPRTRNQAALSAMTTATLEEALHDAATLSGSWTTTYSLVLRRGSDDLGLGLDGLGASRLGERCEAEFILAYILNAARVALGNGLRPTRVSFQHDAPLAVDAHREYFGSGLRFGAPRSEIMFAADLLATPMGTAHPGLHELIARHLATSGHPAADPSTADRVCAELAARLPSGAIHLEDVASVLHMSQRTLHRRLAAEGTTFRALREQVRRQRALELLERSCTGTQQVASQLGFASARGFHRAFRRWTGSSPRQAITRR